MEDKQKMFKTFYSGGDSSRRPAAASNFGHGFGEDVDEEDEEDEEDEADYDQEGYGRRFPAREEY